jgi:hypothetical protein
MLCVGGASSVSKEKDLSSRTKRVNNPQRYSRDSIVKPGVEEQPLLRLEASLDSIPHESRQGCNVFFYVSSSDPPYTEAYRRSNEKFRDLHWKLAK